MAKNGELLESLGAVSNAVHVQVLLVTIQQYLYGLTHSPPCDFLAKQGAEASRARNAAKQALKAIQI